MEGGEAILADPSLIARNYRAAVKKYLADIDELVRTTGVDYHRAKLHERYDEVLVRFLLGRDPRSAPRDESCGLWVVGCEIRNNDE